MNPGSMLASTSSETCSELSDEDIRSLLEFIGYGNPAGRFWFLGMEEAGDLKAAELVTRAIEFCADAEVQERFNYDDSSATVRRLGWQRR
jgi:hypothetical protein